MNILLRCFYAYVFETAKGVDLFLLDLKNLHVKVCDKNTTLLLFWFSLRLTANINKARIFLSYLQVFLKAYLFKFSGQLKKLYR